MKQTKIIKRTGNIASFARFGLLSNEAELLEQAAILDERSLGDFCRIASLQRARLIVTQAKQENFVVTEIENFHRDTQELTAIREKLLGEELPFKEKE